MAFEGIVRYADLVKALPTGSFYDSSGSVLPYYSSPVELRLQTGTATTKFGVYVNEVYTGAIYSDANGNAEFSRKLPLGEIELKLVNLSTGRSFSTYVTTRNYGCWLAAYAEALEDIDDNIQRVDNALRIESVGINEIEDVFGEAIQTYMNFNIGLESYRWLVQELRIGYRNVGSRFRGLDEAIGGFTQVDPFGYSRRKWGPNWVLNSSLLVNNNFLERSHTLDWLAGGPNPSIDGITPLRAEPDVSPNFGGSFHTLDYNATTKELSWRPNACALSLVRSTPVTEGEVFLPGRSYFREAYVLGFSGPFNITSAGADTDNDHLYLNLDNRGVIDITLTSGAAVPLATIITDINTALAADIRYTVPYSSTAYTYNGALALGCPSAHGSTLEVLHGPNNAAGVLFGAADPNIITFDPTGPSGVTLQNIYGPDFTVVDASPTAYAELEVDTTVSPATLRWKSPNGAYGGLVNISGDGVYQLTDTLSNILDVFIFEDDLPALATTTHTFTLGYNRYNANILQTQGIWVNISLDDLPLVNQSARLEVYDDTTDGFAESPDNWYVTNLSAFGLTAFAPSEFNLDKLDPYDPSPSFAWVLYDPASATLDVICRISKYPLMLDTPRGSAYPQKSSGGVYDYEGLELKFCGWILSNIGISQTATLSLSFDGGDNWLSSGALALTTDLASSYGKPDYVEYTATIPREIAISTTNWTDAGVLGKITLTSSGAATGAALTGFNAKVKYITSSSLTNATVPRTRHRQYFGELLWTWAPDPLTLTEKKYIGLYFKDADRTTPLSGVEITEISSDTPDGLGTIDYEYNSTGPTYRLRWNPYNDAWGAGLGWVSVAGSGDYTLAGSGGSYIIATVDYSLLTTLSGSMPAVRTREVVISDLTSYQGHARWISPAHSSIDLFDTTEYDVNDDPVNLIGAVTEADFSLCGFVNSDMSSNNPFKFSYCFPEFLSQEGELLSFSAAGPNYVATLGYYSDQDQVDAILYEDGIPLPNDEWSFSAANQVTVLGASYDPSKTYTIDYDLIYQVTTPVYDLGVNYTDYSWFVDYHLWERFDSNLGEYLTVTPVNFNVENGKAYLDNPSTSNKALSKLTVQRANENVEIARRYWRFIDDYTIELDISQIISGQYYLEHYEKRVYEQPRLNITFEHRSADTSGNVLLASWSEVEKNEHVGTSSYPAGTAQQYHQLRISISGVRTLNDFRLRSLVLKGLHLHGASPSVEGLTNVWSVW